jgi:transglutaminase-like putative cysteine protease
MIRLQISHRTVFSYANPVQLQRHRFMCRPRDSHELSIISARITVSPPATLRWTRDVFSNSVLWLDFAERATELVVQSDLEVEHYPVDPYELQLDLNAQTLPFSYLDTEAADLQPYLFQHCDDPDGLITQWAQSFVEASQGNTLATLTAMNNDIKQNFAYQRRSEHGTWTATQTLGQRGGTCRDFTLLMMEAARRLGIAARFASGYLYDDSKAGAPGNMVGGGETHAWAQLYLPGEGWVAFDPTNALVAGRNLIEVAVARDPDQAAPLVGGFTGLTGDALGMVVEVSINQL